MPSHTPRYGHPWRQLEAARPAFRSIATLAATVCALLIVGSTFSVAGALANSYTGMLSASAGGQGEASNNSAGFVYSTQSWSPPNGMQFAGFAYTGATFFSNAGTSGGGISAGFVGTGGSAPATLMFPWTDDCSITNSGHDWVNGSGAAKNNDCNTGGSTGGWNYNNSELESTSPSTNPETAYGTLTLEAFCQSASCPAGEEYEDYVTNLSADINDPNNQPTGGGSWTTSITGGTWYQSDTNAPALNVSASDPAGVCAVGVQWNGPGDYYSQVTDDNPGMENVGGAIGNEFDNIQPCGTGSASGTASMPAGIASGTYSLAILASNPGNWEGGAGLGNAPTVASYGNAINIDDTTPSASWADPRSGWTSNAAEPLDVTVGPSGVSSVSCTDNGSNVAPTLISGSTGGGGTTVWSVPTPTNGTNAVSCSLTNGDANGGLTGTTAATFRVDTTVPIVSFADSGYTPSTWTNASQTVTVTATGGPSGIESLACSLDGNSSPLAGPDSDQVTISGNGQHVLECTATSNTGVTGQATYDVWVDTRQPTVTFSGAAAAPTWLTGTPTVVVIGSETGGTLSGITKLVCTVNGASPITMNVDAAQGYTSSFVLTANGSDVLSCQATDAAGTTGGASTETVNVDNPSVQPASSSLTRYGSSPDLDNGGDPFTGGPSQTTWYHNQQSVTVSAINTAGGAAISQIACTGASQTESGGTYTANSQNAYGNGGETITVTVQPPGGDLSCSATDTAGNTYPLGSYEFEIDSQAPTGYFEQQNVWPEPDEVQVHVTDGAQGSGTATVEVTAQEAGGPVYKVMATRDPSRADVWDAYFNDSTIPTGVYTFVAYPTDVADNSGSITTSQDGGTETLELPLRAMTSLSDKLSAGGSTATGSTQQTVSPTAAGIASKSTNMRGHHDVSAAAKKDAFVTVAYGQTAKLTGTLINLKSGKPVAHASVVLEQRVVGRKAVKKLGTTKTNSTGRYVFRVKAGASRTLLAVYNGTPLLRGAQANVSEYVRGKASLNVIGTLKPGHDLSVSGKLDGGFIPHGGALVTIQYAVQGFRGWTNWGDTRTTPSGAFTVHMPILADDAGHTFQWRAVISGQTGWAYLAGDSNTVSRPIT
jgi:5-hydroxyisourate hydrolase-like protein (transthyretin family)